MKSRDTVVPKLSVTLKTKEYVIPNFEPDARGT